MLRINSKHLQNTLVAELHNYKQFGHVFWQIDKMFCVVQGRADCYVPAMKKAVVNNRDFPSSLAVTWQETGMTIE